MQKLKTLFLSYECAPFLKRGGLGDVALGLPKELSDMGHSSRVMMPKYSEIDAKKHKLKLLKKNIPIQLGKKTDYFNLYVSRLPKNRALIYFIEHRYFNLKKLFGYKDDRKRFFFFSQACLEAIKAIKFQPDIMHCNDWHTGLVPLMLKKKKETDKFYKNIKTIYSIHNLAFQGITGLKDLKPFDIEIKYPRIPNEVNSMAQGIIHADIVGTVSETYADEILTEEYGLGLEWYLKQRKKEGKLFGIVNGLDYEVFDPKTDKAINQKYDVKSIKKKEINKIELQKLYGFEVDNDIPVIGLVSRLGWQKGLELIVNLPDLKETNYRIVVLGTGVKKYEQALTKLSAKYPQSVGAKIMFDASLAMQIYSGVDMFLMPSRYEPCGLGQLIAMRYGTVPVVRRTGGLNDTVTNYSPKTANKATGFIFDKFETTDLHKAILRAVKVYKNKKNWDKLVKNCLKQDFSWEHAAKKYVKVYEKLMKG